MSDIIGLFSHLCFAFATWPTYYHDYMEPVHNVIRMQINIIWYIGWTIYIETGFHDRRSYWHISSSVAFHRSCHHYMTFIFDLEMLITPDPILCTFCPWYFFPFLVGSMQSELTGTLNESWRNPAVCNRTGNVNTTTSINDAIFYYPECATLIRNRIRHNTIRED